MYRQKFWDLQNIPSSILIIAEVKRFIDRKIKLFFPFNTINIIKYYLLKNYKGGCTHLVLEYHYIHYNVLFICVDWLSRIFMGNHTTACLWNLNI